MTRRFIVRPGAEDDIQAAVAWYDAQRPGLGGEFLAAVREKLEAVRNFPESHPIVYRDIRRAVLARFPYLIFYVVRPTRVAVLAVLHHARNPAVWPRG